MGVVTPFATLAFPALFTPRRRVKDDPTSQLVYSATLIFSPDEQNTPAFEALKAAARDEFKAKYPDKKMVGAYANPFRKGSEVDYEGFGEEDIYIAVRTTDKPAVNDVWGNEIPDSEAKKVFAGQLVRAYVNPWAYDKSGNRGVTFFLNGIQIIDANRPRIDGRVNSDKMFPTDDLEEFRKSAPKPSAGAKAPAPAMADDDMPF